MISTAYYLLMRHIPPLPAVRVFEAAARHENFTSAAAELGMTQAAVSYQIRLLEERLGIPLFIRAKRRVTLSEAGRRAAPLVSGAFDTLADAFAALVAEDEGVLSISTTQTFASNWLAPRIGGFQIARPELAVRLHTDAALADFARDDVDLAIRSGPGDWPGLRHRFLFRLLITPMCSPEFRDRHRILVPQDLLGVPRLSPDDPWWKSWFAAAGVVGEDGTGRRGIRLDTQVAEGMAATAGQGVAMLNPNMWRNEVAGGRLVPLFPLVAIEGPTYWLVYPEHKRRQAKIRAFRDWILAEVAALAAEGPAEAFAPPGASA